jgi:hypothetical protein
VKVSGAAPELYLDRLSFVIVSWQAIAAAK